MITIKSIRTEENKLMALFVKDESFFTLFSKFMLNCGIEWDFNENREGVTNIMESYKNNFFDIDLCFCDAMVFVIIRTFNEEYLEDVRKWIGKNTTWQNPKSRA
jgi:hypothetical protein